MTTYAQAWAKRQERIDAFRRTLRNLSAAVPRAEAKKLLAAYERQHIVVLGDDRNWGLATVYADGETLLR